MKSLKLRECRFIDALQPSFTLPGGKTQENGAPARLQALTAKRAYDVLLSSIGLVLLAPILVLVAILVKFTHGKNVIFSQVRVGLKGRRFRIYKFRTMVPQAETAGPCVTKDGDQRITWIGKVLRKTKLDELPQLWNVLKGDMSLVGPRPEVPEYVDSYTHQQRAILNVKPGITDLASLCFRNEEALLARADDVEHFYIRFCIPRKLHLNQEYAQRANVLTDTWIILQTICPLRVGMISVYVAILACSFWFSYLLIHDFNADFCPKVSPGKCAPWWPFSLVA